MSLPSGSLRFVLGSSSTLPLRTRVRPWGRAAMAAAGSVLLVYGCVQSSADLDTGEATTTAETYCADYAAALCDAQQACGCFEAAALALCQEVQRSSCQADVQEPMAAGRRVFEQGNAQACLDGIRSGYGGCAEGDAALPDACSQVTAGILRVGDECADDYDCAGQDVCRSARCVEGAPEGAECIPGPDDLYFGIACAKGTFCHVTYEGAVCASEGTGADSAPCEAERDCVDGLFCVFGMCTSPGYDGAPCAQDAHCAEGLGCVDVMGWTECRSLQAIGSECAASSECVRTAYCSGGRECSPAPGAGDPCGCDGPECYVIVCEGTSLPCWPGSPCQADSYCDYEQGGVCTAQHEEEFAPCSQRFPDPCGEGLVCDARCVDRPGEAAACSDSMPCSSSFFCDSATGECAALKGEDAPEGCTEDEECILTHTCDGTSCVLRPTTSAGGSCDSDRDCAVEEYCCVDDALCTVGSCTGRRPLDGVCETGEPCMPTQYCSEIETPPRCTTLPMAGQECAWDMILGPRCAPDLACGDDYMCHEYLELHAPCSSAMGGGMPWGTGVDVCGPDRMCVAGCVPAAADGASCGQQSSPCDPDTSVCLGEQCMPLPGQGEACVWSTSTPRQCAAGLHCAYDGLCVAGLPAGERCATDLECGDSLACSVGVGSVCEPRGGDGDVCAASEECLSGHCSGGLCAKTSAGVCAL